MRQLMIFSAFALFMSTTLFAQVETAASAEEAAKAMEAAKKLAADGKVKQGWTIGAKVGASGSFLQNSNFVGQAEGVTLQFGGLLSGNAGLRKGSHDWQNTLTIEHAQLKSPTIDSFIKAADALELKSLYLFRIPALEWMGPYARGRAFTQIFPGYGISAENAVLTETNGGEVVDVSPTLAQKRFDLTTWFEPLILEEAVGFFVEPLNTKAAAVTLTVGLGSQQVFTQGGRAVSSVEGNNIQLSTLNSVFSVGAETGIDAKGVLIPKVLSWNANAGVYYPFINSQNAITGLDLLHVKAGGGLSLKLSKWVAVDYALKILKQPFVLQEYQIQNQLLITTGFDLL